MLEVRQNLQLLTIDQETKFYHSFQPSFFPQLLVNRSKRKRRRRADKALTGTEKVKIVNMRTGKKVESTKYVLF